MNKIEQMLLIGSFLPSLLFYLSGMTNGAIISFLGAFIALALWVFTPNIQNNTNVMTFLKRYL